MVKGNQCHSNHSPQPFELEKKQKTDKNKTNQDLNVLFVIFFS